MLCMCRVFQQSQVLIYLQCLLLSANGKGKYTVLPELFGFAAIGRHIKCFGIRCFFYSGHYTVKTISSVKA